jgi:hypothetical protein
MRIDITDTLSMTVRERIYSVSAAVVQDVLSLIDSQVPVFGHQFCFYFPPASAWSGYIEYSAFNIHFFMARSFFSFASGGVNNCY